MLQSLWKFLQMLKGKTLLLSHKKKEWKKEDFTSRKRKANKEELEGTGTGLEKQTNKQTEEANAEVSIDHHHRKREEKKKKKQRKKKKKKTSP